MRWGVARYRPWVVTLAAVLVVAFVPGVRHGTGKTASDADGGGTGGSFSTVTSAPASTSQESNAGAGLSTAGPAVTTAARAATGPAAASGSRAAANVPISTVVTYKSTPPAPTTAGIGTPAALDAPDCDKATGLIKMSYIWRPNCVIPWPEGADNGGATATGVTADAVKVIRYVTGSQTNSDEEIMAGVQADADAFQAFYRMWGRKVAITLFRASGTDEVAQRADAIELANKKPFIVAAATGGTVLQRELASRGVIYVTSGTVGVKDSLLRGPYLWGAAISADNHLQRNMAQYLGRRLLGKPAKWAGQADYQIQTRKLGVVYPDTWELAPFNDTLAEYGGKVALAIGYSADQTTWGERSQLIVARLKDAGVTSVVAFTDLLFTNPLTAAATSQNYRPEWLTTGYAAQDLNLIARTYDTSQWQHAFGVANIPLGGDANTLWPQYWFFKWYWGDKATNDGPFMSEAMVIFGGIHGAGPRLTPQSFRDGNFSRSPQGGAATSAVIAAQSSFGRWGVLPYDDYNNFDDFSEVYWDPVGVATDLVTGQPTPGNYRHLNGGKRWLADSWPTGEPTMFNPDGTAMSYDTYPPNDRPPNYPCNGCPSTR